MTGSDKIKPGDETPNIDTMENGAPALRRGWTTGACATAAAKAAFIGLHSGRVPDAIVIRLPRGQTPEFAIASSNLKDDDVEVAVIKDAGDDPDVTHGATIRARVQSAAGGIAFAAGDGVGTVTKPGLPLKVGDPAINPAPRQMICDNIQDVADDLSVTVDVLVTISIDNGEALAAKTWNPRLGILGGLSVLGTTGIVIPYSCSAWIASIHQAIDVGRAAGVSHMAGTTGSTSEAAVARDLGLVQEQIIDMGDFVGGMLKHLRDHPVERITIAGGFGKISKLAAGHMDLHSKRSKVDPQFLADLAAEAGFHGTIVNDISHAVSAGEILVIVDNAAHKLGDVIAARARDIAAEILLDRTKIDVRIYDRAGTTVGIAL